MRRCIYILFALILFNFFETKLHAQKSHYLNFFNEIQDVGNDTVGSFNIIQDENIERLVFNHLADQQGKKVQGYRINVYFGRGQEARKKWDKVYIELEQQFKIKPEKAYEHPYYKVYIGNFRTYSEAFKFSRMLEYKYDPLIVGPIDIVVN